VDAPNPTPIDDIMGFPAWPAMAAMTPNHGDLGVENHGLF